MKRTNQMKNKIKTTLWEELRLEGFVFESYSRHKCVYIRVVTQRIIGEGALTTSDHRTFSTLPNILYWNATNDGIKCNDGIPLAVYTR
jgi:hypothetical protein